MFLSVVILGRFTTETHAMALYVSIDTPPLLTPHPGTQPRIDRNGKLTLRHNSRLHHIGMGRRYAGTNVLLLIHDLHIRVVTTDGHLLRELQLDPTKNYQPQIKP
jgi:hypothetical protein